MANFWDGIIDKITGRKDKEDAAKVDISQVAQAAAVSADAKLQKAKEEAAKAEADRILKNIKDEAAKQKALAEQQAKEAADKAAAEAANAIAEAASEFTIIKEHKLTYDDTLSALALHFYGHATPEYWGLIILANKKEIGEKVSDYTPGKVIKIPALPDSMKK